MNAEKNMALGPVMTSVTGTSLSEEDKQRLASPAIGGVVLFSQNCCDIEQIQKLAQQIHALREPSLLIAVDQEGGRVQRICDGVTKLPAAALYGKLFDSNRDLGCDAAELGGELMALEVLQTGIDLSFSPVLDIASHQSEVIGDRAFHSNPEAVSLLAESWIRGMQSAGMKSVAKHFPGHGGVSQDSHLETPEDMRSIHEIMSSDLVPYRRLSNRIDSVMTAHVAFPDITQAIPTYSSFWIEHILREVLAFYGPVFSDDLTMKGAHDAGEIGARVLASLSSGCDIALICQDVNETDSAIEQMMLNRGAWREATWQIDKLRPEVPAPAARVEHCRDALFEILDSAGISS